MFLTENGKNIIISRLCRKNVDAVNKLSDLDETNAVTTVTTVPGEILIDSLEFACGARCMTGTLPVCNMQRLADVLADNAGNLAWTIQGEVCADIGGATDVPGSRARLPFLRIGVRGELRLLCQRCLDTLPFVVCIDSRLLLVPPGVTWPDEDPEDDRFDPIEALSEQPLLALIEEEVLLALPTSPRHEFCVAPEHDDGRATLSPFAGLAQLKNKSH